MPILANPGEFDIGAQFQQIRNNQEERKQKKQVFDTFLGQSKQLGAQITQPEFKFLSKVRQRKIFNQYATAINALNPTTSIPLLGENEELGPQASKAVKRVMDALTVSVPNANEVLSEEISNMTTFSREVDPNELPAGRPDSQFIRRDEPSIEPIPGTVEPQAEDIRQKNNVLTLPEQFFTR